MNQALAIIAAIVMFVVIIIIPGMVASFVVRRFGGSADPTRGARTDLARVCPRCHSNDVKPLPPDRVSPFPGYVCQQCELRLRPHGTRIFYWIILFLSSGLAVVTSVLLWDGDGDVGLLITFSVVAVYSIRQLLRPTAGLTRSLPYSPRRESAEKLP